MVPRSCPVCGHQIQVQGLGRKPLNIPLINICEALRSYRDIRTAANILKCSQGYIYNALKARGLKLREVINSQENPVNDENHDKQSKLK
jgi:hypothetical protein